MNTKKSTKPTKEGVERQEALKKRIKVEKIELDHPNSKRTIRSCA